MFCRSESMPFPSTRVEKCVIVVGIDSSGRLQALFLAMRCSIRAALLGASGKLHDWLLSNESACRELSQMYPRRVPQYPVCGTKKIRVSVKFPARRPSDCVTALLVDLAGKLG